MNVISGTIIWGKKQSKNSVLSTAIADPVCVSIVLLSMLNLCSSQAEDISAQKPLRHFNALMP